MLRGRLRYQLEEFINSGVADEAMLPLWSWICYLTYLQVRNEWVYQKTHLARVWMRADLLYSEAGLN